MILKNKTCFVGVLVTLATLALLSSGCKMGPEEFMQRLFPANLRNVNGTWIGRVERVKLYNYEGQEFDGAELHIEKGPVAKGYYPGDLKGFPGQGRVPVLVGWEHTSYRPIDPEQLPIGHRVKISGVLFVYPISRSPGGFVSRQMYLGVHMGGDEQILYVPGNVDVIDE